MIPHLRKIFNDSFTEEKYQAFLDDLNAKHPGAIEFRIAETPVFVPDDFREKMISACESIVDIITAPGFREDSVKAIPPVDFVRGNETHPHFIAFDFGVCINEKQELEPQLIEMQGFPTLYGFQVYYPEMIQKHFSVTRNFTQYLGNYDRPSYLKALKKFLSAIMKQKIPFCWRLNPSNKKPELIFTSHRIILEFNPFA